MIRVVLADDQALVRAGFKALLDAQDDIEVVGEADDGDEGVARAQELHPDVVLMDVKMPGMDGIEATRAIRAMEARNASPRVPIVALTADALETGKRACRDAGMDGFLTKPVDPAELEEMVQALFPSGEGLPHTAAA